LDTFITSYLIQRFDFVEIKWKQGIIDKSVNGTLNKVVNDLDFQKLIIINPSMLNHEVEKFKIDCLLSLISFIYLKLGMESSLKFIQNSCLEIILKHYQFKKIDYKKEIDELFAHKFNTFPRFEFDFDF
jgi:dsRNA-specific ribonuclease